MGIPGNTNTDRQWRIAGCAGVIKSECLRRSSTFLLPPICVGSPKAQQQLIERCTFMVKEHVLLEYIHHGVVCMAREPLVRWCTLGNIDYDRQWRIAGCAGVVKSKCLRRSSTFLLPPICLGSSKTHQQQMQPYTVYVKGTCVT